MSQTLELRMLRRVPKKYRHGRPYTGEELQGLDTAYNIEWMDDAFHAPIRTVSCYASMDDVKGHILENKPDADLSCWSMHNTWDKGAEATLGDGTKVVISPETMKSLERDHETTYIYENQEQVWSVEISVRDSDWLKSVTLGYVTKAFLKKLLDSRLAFSDDMTESGLDESISEYGENWSVERDLFGLLSDALALARHKKMALYICLLD